MGTGGCGGRPSSLVPRPLGRLRRLPALYRFRSACVSGSLARGMQPVSVAVVYRQPWRQGALSGRVSRVHPDNGCARSPRTRLGDLKVDSNRLSDPCIDRHVHVVTSSSILPSNSRSYHGRPKLRCDCCCCRRHSLRVLVLHLHGTSCWTLALSDSHSS